MKWLLMLLAFVLGAAITWFLTVKRVTRTVSVDDGAADVEAAEPDLTPVVSPGEPVAGAVGVAGGADLAAAAGAGVLAAEAPEISQTSEAADSAVDDEDGEEGEDDADNASRFGGSHTEPSEAPGAAEEWDRDAQDEDALMPASAVEASDPGAESEEDVPPVVDATPNGDLAGVGNPAEVAEVDGHVEAQQSAAAGQASDSSSTGDVAGVSQSAARHEQGELTFDDEPEPPKKPKKERGGTAV
ncbi:hypothetical protein GCM10009721_31830 [Terrabacter tumescens]|uniref:Uncharacterized protein n=1 Tax=Terrabacter tumescens TaxID=60443 RepID=A0ABQ2IA22_9MICO|nr:hypothetical protein [Terrabacter tumescens]GGN02264.1 hypothetical protein GCM10009721_31830 [Terrabacter tumescens]